MGRFLNSIKYCWADTQTRLVTLLTVFVAVIILAVGLTSYYTSKSVLQSELSEPQHQSLRIGMNYIDKYIQDTNYIAIKIALQSNVYNFLTMQPQNSYNNINQLYQFLETLLVNSPYLDSIYIYDRDRQSFVAYPQGFSSSSVTMLDSGWVDVADRFGDKLMVVESREAPGSGVSTPTTKITLFRKVLIQGQFKGIVAINFKGNALFQNMQPEYVSGVSRAQVILGKAGNLIYSAGGKPVDTDEVHRALAKLNGEPFGDWSDASGERLLVSHARSPVTEWDYVSIVSQDRLLSKSQTIRDVVLAVSFIALILGAAAIMYTHSLAFKPVRRIRSMLTTYGQNEERSDLIGLEKVTGKLLKDHAKLSSLIRQTMPEASSKFVYDMFLGNIQSKKEIAEKWRSYFSEWSAAPLTVVVISIDRYREWGKDFPEKDHLLLKYALANIASELLAAGWRNVCLDLGRDLTAVVLQPSSAEAPPLKEKVEETIQIIRRLLHFSVSAGISQPYAEVGRLKLALHEAENALSYRLYQGYGCVIPYKAVADHEMGETFAGESVIGDLTGAIETGSEERSLRITERLLRDIREHCWYPSAALSFLNAVTAKLNRMTHGKETGAWEEPDSDRSYQTMSLQDIGEGMSEQVRALVSRFGDLIQSKEFIMVQSMIDYMKKHLGENIGVQEIAASIGISVSLASQMFKQETNETIHEYFTKLRMERAAELLLETGSKISDIALMVGYQHENSFIRVFRKYKDITPGKYRELMRNHDASFNSLNS
ncbi:helix-turn-helix domain-containing protein [Paenibacillus doosanensis]|uniref:helix-turn-helix domain-containing protein n=1 Tax=Paenibacillus doosanensis TaxID=1229154 RepID=UPI00217F70BF|nr:helix-turn-helix domain-containing protein [Paenibacillus doosanensis]MCS7464917.1 helix-turn-helix domain-containing protein [Paenibacillus doosanensis]